MAREPDSSFDEKGKEKLAGGILIVFFFNKKIPIDDDWQ